MARSSPKRVFSNLVLNLLISRSTPGWRRNREELHSLPDHADVPLRLHYHGDLGLPDALRFIYSLLHLLLQVAAHRASGGGCRKRSEERRVGKGWRWRRHTAT